MLVEFSPTFEHTKKIFGYNFGAPLTAFGKSVYSQFLIILIGKIL